LQPSGCLYAAKQTGCRGHWPRPFFFVEPTVTSINYLAMLQLWLMPQLQEDGKDFVSNKMEPHHTSILTPRRKMVSVNGPG
jgi:hypothetical protein